MRSWPSPTVPALPTKGPLPVLGGGDRLGSGGTARLYTCGITPYDATHLGHAATYLMVDTLRRSLTAAGVHVEAAQNVTDVDEPLFERAERDGIDWRDLARREIELFRTDMEWLRVIPPEHYTGVVEAIPTVVTTVERLTAAGVTYRVAAEDAGEGVTDVYLDLGAVPTFGEVSGLTRDQMLPLFAERGGDPGRPGKRDPLDPLLWRGERPGEPSYEGGTLGRGRPGWHVECTAIALDHLGCGFDVQAGGTDLVFPHHEMSAAQAAALPDGCAFAREYVHQAMVGLDGEKMSKSRGNLVFVHTLREQGVDPAVVRAAMLAHHHGAEWSWSDDQLALARSRVDRWRGAAAAGTGAGEEWLDRFLARVADDLDTPGALDLLDAWAGGGAVGGTPAEVVVDAADALLGIVLRA